MFLKKGKEEVHTTVSTCGLGMIEKAQQSMVKIFKIITEQVLSNYISDKQNFITREGL